MRYLITGISGFVGSHLAEYILKVEPVAEVFGTVRLRSNLDNLSEVRDLIKLRITDIRDAHSVAQVIRKVKPNKIFHLAAISFVPASWQAPLETIETNVTGTLNLLEAVRQFSPSAKILVAGSSEEYGLVQEDELPIKETNPLRPLSPYGVSKVAQDLLSWQYYKSYGLNIIITRAFNHTGPRRPSHFVVSSFCYQIAKQEREEKDEIALNVGNLKAFRDFLDVRDVVEAYYKIMNSNAARVGEVYNICRGKAYRISDIIAKLTGMSFRPVTIKPDPSRLRPSDVPVLIGDNSKLKEILPGWEPRYTFEQTISDCLNWWRLRLRRKEIT